MLPTMVPLGLRASEAQLPGALPLTSLPGMAQEVPLVELPGIRSAGHSHDVYL